MLASLVVEMGKRLETLSCLLLVIMISLLCGQAHSIRRHTQQQAALEVEPTPLINSSPNNFFSGYLPKATPIPPSGPSKRHNDIGS